jgi:hypothetical protein
VPFRGLGGESSLEISRNGLQSALQGNVRSLELMPRHAGVCGCRSGRDGEKGCEAQHLGFNCGHGDAPLIEDDGVRTCGWRDGWCNDLISAGGGDCFCHVTWPGGCGRTTVDRWRAPYYLDLGINAGASASTGAGVAAGFFDELYRTEEFALKAEAREVWRFLDFAAKYSFTSAFLMRVTGSPIGLFAYLKGDRLERSKES